MKTYAGDRTIDGILGTVDGEPLDPRTDIEHHSDEGFEWTYEGTAPHQLALAILADHLGDDARARDLSGIFMREVVANFDNTWEMTGADVDAALQAIA